MSNLIATAFQNERQTIKSCAVILIASLITACGGGGHGSSTPPDTTQNPPPGSFGSQTGKRLARILYDLDNNGVYEGERTFSFDNDGRVTAENYTYHADATPDTTFGSFSIGAPSYNETVAYDYNAEGLVALWSITDPSGRTEFSNEYGTNNLIDSQTLSFFDNGGALLQSISFNLTNENNQLTRWDSRIASAASAFQSDVLTYDAAGRVQSDVLTQGSNQTESIYTYSATGKIFNIKKTGPAYHGNINFEYGAGDRLSARVSSADEVSDAYRWRYQYDANGLLSEEQIDLLDDGTAEASMRYEYEDGACSAVFIWAPRGEPNFVKSATRPYAPGSGYAVIPVCANAAN